MVVATIKTYDFNSAEDLQDWSSGTRTIAQGDANYEDSYYLGPQNEDDAPLTVSGLSLPGQSNQVTVTFDLYELDLWNNLYFSDRDNERLNLTISEQNSDGVWEDKTIEIGDFAPNVGMPNSQYDETGRTTWTDQGVTITKNSLAETNINGGVHADQQHQFTLTFDTTATNQDRELKFSFEQVTDTDYGDGSFGIDNFTVSADTDYLSDDAYKAALAAAENMDFDKGPGVTSSLSQLTANLNFNLDEASNAANRFNANLRDQNLSESRVNGSQDYEITNEELTSLFDATVESLETWAVDGEMGAYAEILWQQMSNSNAPTEQDISGFLGNLGAFTYLVGSIAGGYGAAAATTTTFAQAVGAVSYLAGSAAGTANALYEAGEDDYFDDDKLTGLASDVKSPGAGSDVLIFELAERGLGEKRDALQTAAEDAGIGLGNIFQNYQLAQMLDDIMSENDHDRLLEMIEPEAFGDADLGFGIVSDTSTPRHLGYGQSTKTHTLTFTSSEMEHGPQLNGVDRIELEVTERLNHYTTVNAEVTGFSIDFL